MHDNKNLPEEFWTDAKVRMPEDGDIFTVQMNADQLRMYVAAPELLKVLEANIEAMDAFGITGGAIDAGRAAIAKAKGDTA